MLKLADPQVAAEWTAWSAPRLNLVTCEKHVMWPKSGRMDAMVDHEERMLIRVLAMWGAAAGAVIGFFIGALGADSSGTVTTFGMLTVIGSLAFVGGLGGYLLGTELIHGRGGSVDHLG
jgi:hypothetical protein